MKIETFSVSEFLQLRSIRSRFSKNIMDFFHTKNIMINTTHTNTDKIKYIFFYFKNTAVYLFYDYDKNYIIYINLKIKSLLILYTQLRYKYKAVKQFE